MRTICLFIFLLLAPAPSAQDRPNVLWLVVEDMSPWIACYGDDTVPTPNLDRLAGQSVRYEHAYATSPVCAPARSSIITGMFATRIGTMQMRTGNPSKAAIEKDPEAYAKIPSYEGVPPEFVRCFPEHLRAAGYYCTNNSKKDYQFKEPGTVWDLSSGKAHWRDRGEGQPFFAVFNHGGTHESQAFPKSRKRPVVVEPADVPIPPIYPDTPAVRDALSRTYNNIAAMDEWVGGHLEQLEEAGLADSTWVFFYSDHGVGLPRGKRSPYDTGTRVPLLVRAPDGAGAGTVEERVVSFVDLGPTVLSLAGLEPDGRLDGRAFLGDHAREASGYAFAHADRFDAVYDRARSVTDGRWRYVRNYLTDVPYVIPNAYRERIPMTADIYALRDRPDELPPGLAHICATTRPEEELYDSDADPWEIANLALEPDSERSAILERLRGALDDWIEDTGDLGLVLPEKRMVAEHLWPDLTRPKTAAPSISVADGQVTLTSTTPGASLGFRFAPEEPWRVYTGPIPFPSGGRFEALAHRIGYEPARSKFEVR